ARRAQVRTELSDAAVVSRSWGMAFATLISRLTGFLRIVLLAAILGAALSSAFSVANQLPNLIAALVLEATFTAIFVPVLARAERDDADHGASFVRRLVTLATALLLLTTILSVLAAPLLVHLMLGDDPQVNAALTTAFAYLLLPQVVFYGLSSVFMAILNNRNIFGPPAWAPVVNNVVAIATLVLYLIVPGELSIDPVEMGNAKLLVLGIGTTLGVFAQTAVLLVAIRRERVSLKPLWGVDERLQKFGAMAAAMVLYVLISQIGLVVCNQIASAAAASGPAIYNYTWLVLMLPFGIIGVTVLTVVMPRLSRNAAADNNGAVLADLSLATRLTMVTLIPIVALMTVGGPAIGSALFAYGNFGEVDAAYLGNAITLSAFTLIPYALTLVQLRVFYAREQPWTPITIIVVITAVKIAASVLAPHLTDDPQLVAGYLGLANGIGFVAGATVGHILLRRALRPPRGGLIHTDVVRTILVAIAASLLAAMLAHAADQLLGFERLTVNGGGLGSLVRLAIIGVIMMPIVLATMVAARVPDALAAVGFLRRKLGRKTPPVVPASPDNRRHPMPVPYSDHNNRFAPTVRQGGYEASGHVRRVPPAPVAGPGRRKGPAVSDQPARQPVPDATARIPRQTTDDVEPDVRRDDDDSVRKPGRSDGAGDVGYEAPRPAQGRPAIDFAGDPSREALPLAHDSTEPGPADELHLIPGAGVARGRYRLLMYHGGPPGLQFWQALDTALDRQVALTFVDPDGTMTDDQVDAILSRTQRLSRFEMYGIARVLDVTDLGSCGMVVAEWIRGGSLQEVADTAPSPIGGARAIQSLAAAGEATHRAGVCLSIDHPSRVRVSIEGDVALAFPATMPDATPEDDIRGIGAALYALLVNRWPLPESGSRSGLPPAEVDASGQPVEPRAVDPEIPFQISAAAARSVQDNGGIRSAPTLLNLLQQATAIADRTDLIEPVENTEAPGDQRPPRTRTPEERARRRRGLLIGGGVAAVALVLVVLLMVSLLRGLFGDVNDGLNEDQLGLNAPTAAEGEAQAGPGSSVKPVAVTVFSPDGGADNPADARLAIDGNPATVWPTDTYTDNVPFPNFKNGVGLMLQLPQPTVVGEVTVDVTSTGTALQLRASPSDDPGSLDATTELTPPESVQQGENTISVPAAAPTSYLLVWITTMGTTDGENRLDISEITVSAAS
ncbi:MAG: murein biosynthesis integral membrane protein MurJ, partial [Mycobacterium sp.]